MSNVEQRTESIQRLKQEISRLREQQIAPEKIAAFVGMTTEDSEQYKERHRRIRGLTRKLAMLDSEQGGHYEQKETQKIAGPGAESAPADCST